MTPTKATKQPKPFDLAAAQQELTRIRRRAQRLEARAAAFLRKQLEDGSMAAYKATKTAAFVADIRTFIDGK
jgi:hypothetical protein